MSKLLSSALFICAFLLSGLGLVMLASTGYWQKGQAHSHDMLVRQIIVFAVGVILAIFIARLDPVKWIRYWVWIYAIGILFLILCYIPHIGIDVNGAKRWVQIPGLPQFQPSEIGKLTTIIGIAGYFSKRIGEIRTFLKGFVYPSLLISLPVGLVFFEKDMDTALCMGVVAGMILFCIGVSKRYLFTGIIVVGAVGYALVISDPVRRKRFDAHAAFEKNLPQYEDLNRQQKNSLLGFELGGIDGIGIGEGRQKLGFLAEAHTDFIFSVIGEQLGLRMTSGVVILYVLFSLVGLLIACRARYIVGRILAIGCTASIAMPAVINIAVVTALLPNAGLPLPFLSYGGTNLLCTLVNVGIVMRVSWLCRPAGLHKMTFPASIPHMRV